LDSVRSEETPAREEASPAPATPATAISKRRKKPEQTPFKIGDSVDFFPVIDAAYDYYVVQARRVPGAVEEPEPAGPERTKPQTRRTAWCDKCGDLLTDPRHEGCKYFVVCQTCGVKRASLLHFRLAYEKLLKVAPSAGSGMSQYINESATSTAGTKIRFSYTCDGCKAATADDTEALLGL
jgi:DNA-directed RNA polymerase subunit M/transcription elongation factor TFIIS